MEIGRDPYAVFVGGEGPNSDLYAVRPRAARRFASPSPTSPSWDRRCPPTVVTWPFFEARPSRDSTPATVWVMNLLSGGERELVLPKDAGAAQRRRVGVRQ